MQTTIRKATLDDLEKIRELNHKLFLWDYGRDPHLNIDWPLQPAGGEYFTKRITGEPGVCFVAVQEGQTIGYVAGCVNKEIDKTETVLRCKLENIYIEEESRGNGAGKLLTQALVKWCKENGATSMLVTAYAGNGAAISFYKNAGFTPFALTLEQSI